MIALDRAVLCRLSWVDEVVDDVVVCTKEVGALVCAEIVSW